MIELYASPAHLVFATIKQAAINGEKCPSNRVLTELCKEHGWEFSGRARPIEMAREGRLKIELYMRGYRVIEVDGLRTKACPWPGGPLRVFPSSKET